MDTGATPKKFRNAVGGYNKEDVNNYIKETDIQYSSRLEELQNTLNALEAEKHALLKEKDAWILQENQYKAALEEVSGKEKRNSELLAEKDSVILDLQKRLDICRAQTDAQNTVIERLRTEKVQIEENNAALKHSLQEAETAAKESEKQLAEKTDLLQAAKDALDDKQKEMETALAAEKARAEEEIVRFRASFTEDENSTGYKIRMYDKISGQIGDILLGANRDADEIKDAAQADAEKLRTEAAEEMEKSRTDLQAELTRIRQETEQEAIYIRERLSETANDLLANISGELHVNIDNCVKELSTCMTELEYDTETMLQTMQKRYREMNDRIQYYQSCVQDSIDKQLQEMDQKYGIRQAGSSN